jgi:hypothetical protein
MRCVTFMGGLLSLDGTRPGYGRQPPASIPAPRRYPRPSDDGEPMSETQRLQPETPVTRGRSWRRRLAYTGIAVVVLVLGGWIGAAFIPRWWSHRIGDQVSGSIPAGITLGLVYGFLFTVLPLLVLAWAARKRRSWKTWLVLLATAVVLALPNLFTLGIVVGRGNAAHAGERTLDVDAPGFRGGTLAGAIVAALFLVGVGYLLRSRRRARRELDRLRSDQAGSEEPPAPAA